MWLSRASSKPPKIFWLPLLPLLGVCELCAGSLSPSFLFLPSLPAVSEDLEVSEASVEGRSFLTVLAVLRSLELCAGSLSPSFLFSPALPAVSEDLGRLGASGAGIDEWYRKYAKTEQKKEGVKVNRYNGMIRESYKHLATLGNFFFLKIFRTLVVEVGAFNLSSNSEELRIQHGKSMLECEKRRGASLGNFQIFKIFQSARGMAIGHRLGWKSN
jgi:hypothetical protein